MASTNSSFTNIVASLKKEDIFPEVVPESFVPLVLFSVRYPTGHEVQLGNELTKEDAGEEPEVLFIPLIKGAGSESSGTYTLVMTDPDAPSRKEPKFRQFRHWVITGVKAPAGESPLKETISTPGTAEPSNLLAIKTKKSTTPYRPPGPPPGSGVHRYCFLLFEEPEGGFTIPEGAKEYGAALEERRSWNAVEFGERYGLKLVGANFFLVKSVE